MTLGLKPFLGHREFKLGGFWIRVFVPREWGLGGKQESTERGELQRWICPVIGRRETEEEKSSSSCKRDSSSPQHFLPYSCSSSVGEMKREWKGSSRGRCGPGVLSVACSLGPGASR